MSVTSHAGKARRLQREASRWVVRLRMERLDDRQRQQFQQWLASDPGHASALAKAEMAWELTGELRDSPLFAQPVPRARPHAIRRLFSGPFFSGLFVWEPHTSWRWAGVMMVLLVAWFGIVGNDGLAPFRADVQTAVGEIRPLTLADGSKVLLGSNSALAIHYDRRERRVSLLRGEAMFAPTPRAGREERTFVVEAAGGRTQALGTRFLVHRENAHRAWVGVLEHRVKVTLDDNPRSGLAQLSLGRGQSARYSHAAGIVATNLDLRDASDWTHGTLVFEHVPLAQVVQRLDNFRPGLLVLIDRRAAGQPVSALFHIDNLDEAVTTLGTELHLKVRHLPGITILY